MNSCVVDQQKFPIFKLENAYKDQKTKFHAGVHINESKIPVFTGLTSSFMVPAPDKSVFRFIISQCVEWQATTQLYNHAGTISFRALFYNTNQRPLSIDILEIRNAKEE
jgi:hypothetical protein